MVNYTKVLRLVTLLLLSISSYNVSYGQCATPPAIITTNPSNSTVCQGVASTFFSIAASGTTVSYQWQMNTYNSGFVNVTNNATFSGATTSVLTVNNPTTSLDGNGFRCLATAGCATPTVSLTAQLTVNGQHVLFSHPQSQMVCQGNNANFSVAASSQSTNPLSYQWQVAAQNTSIFTNVPNAAPYSGVTSANLAITGAAFSMNGNVYRCVVTGTCGVPTTSNTAQLDVYLPPTITSHPQNAAVCQDANTSFTVAAQGNSTSYNFNYQWQVNTGSGFSNIPGNAAPYSGANSPSLGITSVQPSLNGAQYRCIVSSICTPIATSNAATLTVNNKPVVTSSPLNTTVCEDAAAAFSVAATGTGLLYQWQVAPSGSSVYTNIGNTAPYVGMQTASLSISAAPASFNGNTYRCVVSGTCTPASISSGAELTINNKPAITTQPSNATTCNNNVSATFNVAATGAGLTYQWQVSSGSGYSNLANGAPYSGVTTNTLSIFGGSVALNNNFYRCVVSGTCPPSVTSSAAQLFINMQPAITSSPVNNTVCETGSTSFTVGATGTSLTYQWQVNSGSGFSNLTNTGVYTNVTTATMNITGATTSLNNNQYRCMVSGICAPAVFSNTANLTVNALTVINTQPLNSTVCSGQNSSFTVGATAGNITYQWQVNTGSGFNNIANGAPYVGNQAATLTILGSPASFNANQYRCVVGSTCGPILTSNAVTLTVNTAPAITTAPSASTVCAGTGTAFIVAATGTSLNYQWQLNSGSGFADLTNAGIYTGVNTNALNISSTTAGMNAYQYRVIISGTCTPPISATAQLNVNTAPVINFQPVNSTVCSGNGATFNINASGSGITYQWQVNTGAGFNNVVNGAPYSGATAQSLGVTPTTTAMSGYTFRCIVSGTCPSVLTSNTVTLTVQGLPTIVTNPANTTSCVGTNTVLSVGATGTGLSYQWQANTGSGFNNLLGSTTYAGHNAATLTIYNTQATYNGYQYRCIVSGSCTPPVTSNIATLTVNTLPAVTSNPVASTICAGSGTTFSVTGTGTGVAYQWQVDAGSGYSNITNGGVYSNATTSTLSIAGATAGMNGYGYRCVVSGTCAPSMTSNFALLTVKVPPTITSNPSNKSVCNAQTATFSIAAATGVGITYQWQENAGVAWSNLSNGGIYAGTKTATLTLSNTHPGLRGNSYRCVVSNGCSPDAISTAAVLTVYGNPTIINPPVTTTVCETTPATFTVTVDAKNPTYQWEEDKGTGFVALTNNGTYSLVTTSTLMVSNPTLAMSGYGYRCKVTDDCGSTYTATAILKVDGFPRITKHPVSLTGGYKDKFVYTVDATGAGLTYQWQVDTIIGGNQTFINISDKAGAYVGTTTSKLEVIPNAGYMNLKYYRCIVSGTCNPPAVSNNAKLTVGFYNNVANVANNSVEINIFPNPVNGNTLNVQLGNYNGRDVKVKIFNSMGSVVANEVVYLQNNAGAINVANLATGIYNMQIADTENNTMQVVRFVKQ